MNIKKLKVMCGYANTGGIAFKIAEGLRLNGIKADSLVIDNHSFSYGYHKMLKFVGNKHTFLNRLIKYYYFLKHSLIYDVFIFNTRSTMLSKKGDLKILKVLGKKTAMIYVGCDIRDKDQYLNSSNKYTVCKNCSTAYQNMIRCIMREKYSETKIIQEDVTQSFSHPFDARILKGDFNYLYLLLELEQYRPLYAITRTITIVHIPSDDGIKGTNYVINAIEQLKNENINFEFEIVRNRSHRETIEIIRNADILIDQMVAGWYGLISIESMALGKTTVCYINYELYDYLPDLPIVNLNPDNLANGLKKLIIERDKLQSYGIAGRRFAEKYHDHIKNSLDILTNIIGVIK